jgi:AcrR family transcriptional regulator
MASVDRQQWIHAALQALAEGGIDAVRVEPLAKRLGVTKGSFYWHFAARPALFEALLAHWEGEATGRVIETVDGRGGSPADRLRWLVRRAFGGRGETERAVRAWAAHDERAALSLRRVDERRLAYLEERFREHGLTGDAPKARARLLYTALIGESHLAVVVTDAVRVGYALDNLEALLVDMR